MAEQGGNDPTSNYTSRTGTTPPITGHDELFAELRNTDSLDTWTNTVGDLIPLYVDSLPAYMGDPPTDEDSDPARQFSGLGPSFNATAD